MFVIRASTLLAVKPAVVWSGVICCLVAIYRGLGGKPCLNLEGRTAAFKMAAKRPSQT
jgi:hypothetical protein